MPKPKRYTYVQYASQEFLRGTGCVSPHHAIKTKRRTLEEWTEYLDYFQDWFQRMFNSRAVIEIEGRLVRSGKRSAQDKL